MKVSAVILTEKFNIFTEKVIDYKDKNLGKVRPFILITRSIKSIYGRFCLLGAVSFEKYSLAQTESNSFKRWMPETHFMHYCTDLCSSGGFPIIISDYASPTLSSVDFR